jgi:hypothetical protein
VTTLPYNAQTAHLTRRTVDLQDQEWQTPQHATIQTAGSGRPVELGARNANSPRSTVFSFGGSGVGDLPRTSPRLVNRLERDRGVVGTCRAAGEADAVCERSVCAKAELVGVVLLSTQGGAPPPPPPAQITLTVSSRTTKRVHRRPTFRRLGLPDSALLETWWEVRSYSCQDSG